VRRLGVILTTLAVAFGATLAVAAGASAQSGSDPLAKVKVSAATAGAAPKVTFAKPFAVKKSVHKVLSAGTGDTLAAGNKVTLDYLVVDGRTGKQVSTSYGSSAVALTLDSTSSAPPLVAGLVGATVGSRVIVALAPKDGYAKRVAQSVKTVKKSDTLLFLVDVKGIRHPLARATGDPVAPVDGLPTVTLDATGKPTVTLPSGAAPASLVVQTLITGTGPAVTSGQTITAHYTGVIWPGGKQFDSSWDRGTPSDFVVGQGQVIPGWDKGLVGQTVGSQVLLVVPPADGYGTSGNTSAGISGTDTLVFVIDILDAY
jgi:peptidylprolyl isomerase